MGRCRYSSVDFCPTFFTAIPPTPTLPCLQMAPMRFLPPTLVFAAKAQSVFSLASMLHQWDQEMAQHIGWELIFLSGCYHPRRLHLPQWLGGLVFVGLVQGSCRHWEGHQASWAARVSSCACVWETDCRFF